MLPSSDWRITTSLSMSAVPKNLLSRFSETPAQRDRKFFFNSNSAQHKRVIIVLVMSDVTSHAPKQTQMQRHSAFKVNSFQHITEIRYRSSNFASILKNQAHSPLHSKIRGTHKYRYGNELTVYQLDLHPKLRKQNN